MLKRNIILTALTVLITGCQLEQESYVSKQDIKTEQQKIDVAPYSAPEISRKKKEEFLNAINQARAEARECGDEHFDAAPPLKWSDALYRAAYEHSNDMAQQDFVGHDGSGEYTDETGADLGKKSEFFERVEHNGYQFGAVAENVAAGQKTTDEVINDWIESPHHCANLMNPNFKDVGMAVVKKEGTKYIYYWTQNFATPQGE